MKTLNYIFEFLFESIKTEEADNFLKIYYQREQRKKMLELLAPKPGLIN